MLKKYSSLLLLAGLIGCSSTSTLVESNQSSKTRPENVFCYSNNYLLEHHFEGGHFTGCKVQSDDSFILDIEPENVPINQSAWYAFRISAKQPGTINLDIHFIDGKARYWPKLSSDGIHWKRAKEEQVRFSDDKLHIYLTLAVDETPLWVAGQELLTDAYFQQWMRELAEIPGVKTQLIGHSVLGRPIYSAKTDHTKQLVILLGRQHPPEVTGTLAMREFVKAVFSNTPIANEFRQKFDLLIIPFINPDGVALGHWRHNVNGLDLNRDWGDFSQIETQNIAKLLQEYEKSNTAIAMMLDFHSTYENKFYTQRPEDSHDQVDFTTAWLGAARNRLPDFEFEHVANEVSAQKNSKNYFYKTYAIPSTTYELGDETNRQEIIHVTPVFAEEFMRQMLLRKPKQ